MSFSLMQAVVDMRPPEKQELDTSTFALLIALCRHADDNGQGCYPGRPLLLAETRMAERTLRKALPRLEALGWVTVTRAAGRHNNYTVNAAAIRACLPRENTRGGTPGIFASTKLTTTGNSAGGWTELSTTHGKNAGGRGNPAPGKNASTPPANLPVVPPANLPPEETIEENIKRPDSAREPAAGTPPASSPESVSQSVNNLVSSQSVSPRAAVPASPQPAAPAQAEHQSPGPAATPATARPVPAAPRAPRPACVERIDPNFVPKAIPLPTPPPSSAPAAVPAGVDEGNRRALAALMEAVAARKIREASAPPPPPPPPRPQHVLPQPEWLPCPRQAVLAAWDSILARELGPVPPGSDQMVESFWRTMCRRAQAVNGEEGLQAVRRYLQTVADTPFCVGKAPGTRFRATARWVMDEGRINDVCSGRYAPRESS